MHENVDLVQQIHGAIGRGDIGAAIAMMADDVEIHAIAAAFEAVT